MTVGQYRSAGITLTDAQVAKLQLDTAGNLKTVAGGTGTSADQVQGNVAHDAADSGNPVKVGAVAHDTPSSTSVANNDRTNLVANPNGALYIAAPSGGGDAGTDNRAVLNSFGNRTGASLTNTPVYTAGAVFNGTSWDRHRGNQDTAALITAAGATTSQTGADQTNYNGRGLQVVLDMTNVGTGSVTLTIQGKDAASGKYYTLLVGAAVTTNSTNVYTVYPGAAATANVSAPMPLPRVWRVITTANNANAATYTVGASVIV